MSKDLYESRQMYQSPGILLLLVPLCLIVIVYLFDFGFTKYNQFKLDKDTKEIIEITLSNESKYTIELQQEYFKKEFEKYGYNPKYAEIVDDGEKLIFITKNTYFTIINSLFKKGDKIVRTKYIAYYDNDELKIEKQ